MRKVIALVTATVIGSVALVASPVLGFTKAANKSNGTSATAVYVREPGTCSPIGNLEDNYISDSFEVVVKSLIGRVEPMWFRVFNNGDLVAEGDLDVIQPYCGANYVYTLALVDIDNDEFPENYDDDDSIVDNNDGSLTLVVYFSQFGKKFGSSSFRVPG